MTREEARAALLRLGEPVAFSRTVDSPPGWIIQRNATVFVYCDQAGLVDSIEFGTTGYGEESEDQVLFGDLDLFSTPVTEVLARLRSDGHRIEESESGLSHTLPDLLLGLWRDGGPEDADGLPRFYESALIAAPGYYDS